MDFTDDFDDVDMQGIGPGDDPAVKGLEQEVRFALESIIQKLFLHSI